MPRTRSPACLTVLTLWTLVGSGCGQVEQIADLSYDDRHAATRFDVYLPADPPPPGGRPAVLLVHGGGWRSGSRAHLAGHAERLAGAGYVAVNIDYRLTPSGAYPVAVQDCLCALATVRARAGEWGIDPSRVAALGYSAGGHLVSLIGVAADAAEHQPDCAAGATGPPAAVVAGAGPQDMWGLPQVDAVVDFVGGTHEQVPDRYDAASPLYRVAAGAPPFLLVHGEDDWFVDVDQSRHMQAALAEVGTPGELLTIPGGGHLWNRDPVSGRWELMVSIDTPESWLAMVDFLDRTVGAP